MIVLLRKPRTKGDTFRFALFEFEKVARGSFGESVRWVDRKRFQVRETYLRQGYVEIKDRRFGPDVMANFVRDAWWEKNRRRVDEGQLNSWPDEWDDMGNIEERIKRQAFALIRETVGFYQASKAKFEPEDADKAAAQEAMELTEEQRKRFNELRPEAASRRIILED